jgi:hypothetical protein
MVMTQAEWDACPRVYSRNDPSAWWRALPLTWHKGANTGQDRFGCSVSARIEGTLLRVRHGPDPEQTRLFSLDELNRIGGHWTDPHPVNFWLEQFHADQRG